jgi:hypothetical protein
MSSNVLDTINETDEQFNIELKKIKKDIHSEFLAMAKENRKGYHISLLRAFNWLRIDYDNYKCNAKYREHFKARVLREYSFKEAADETDLNGHYIIRKTTEANSKIQIPWFSDKGFKRLCMIMKKSPKAELVREYYLELEEEYIAVLKMDIEEVTKHQETTLKQLSKKQEEYTLLSKECRGIEEKLHKSNQYNRKLERQQYHLTIKNDLLYSVSCNINTSYDTIDPDDRGNKLRLELYESTYGKPVQLYLVSDTWLIDTLDKELNGKRSKKKSTKKANKKKALNDSDVEDEVDGDPDEFAESLGLSQYRIDMDGIDFESISSVWIQSYMSGGDFAYSEQEFYFYLAKSKSQVDAKYLKLWKTLYFYDDEHYNQFLERITDLKLTVKLQDVANTKNKVLKDMYISQYEAIHNAHKDVAACMAFRKKYPKEEVIAKLAEPNGNIAYE